MAIRKQNVNPVIMTVGGPLAVAGAVIRGVDIRVAFEQRRVLLRRTSASIIISVGRATSVSFTKPCSSDHQRHRPPELGLVSRYNPQSL